MKFYKRFLSLILTFILIISISVPCYASDIDSAESDPAGWNSWSFNDKVIYVTNCFTDLICGFTGIAHGNPSSFKQLALDLYANQPDAGVSNIYEYFANGLSFDDSSETWTLSDDLVEFCNSLIVNYNDRVTMMYRYPFRPDYLEPDWFPNKSMYSAFVDMVKQHPEYYFSVMPESGNKMLSFFVYPSDYCLSAVNSNFDLIVALCDIYDSNWLYEGETFYCTIDSSCMFRSYKTIGGFGGPYFEADNLDDVLENGYKINATYRESYMIRTDDINWFIPNYDPSMYRYLVSSHQGALNCYKSVADMKKDTADQFTGRYTNTYTGTTVNNITQTEINNIVNNYYPPSSDPSIDPVDPGGGGGSGTVSIDYSSFFKDMIDQLKDLNNNLVALSRALVGKDTFEDSLSGVKSNFPDPDDVILASVNELSELQTELQEDVNQTVSFGGALGDIFSKLLDFQTGIDDLVQDEEYIDEVEGLLRQLLPKDPEDNDDDSFFDKILKTIEMSLQLYANSLDEIKETSKKKFPFSIGYDIELLLMLLSAEPQTPVFNIPFEYQRLNYKTEIVIDFSMFDDAIDVIRFFLTIYYCFFLLMITPKMIGLNNEVDS